MSKPFFIWTMRRTGGTSLATLLTNISEYPVIEHEAFNADRTLGSFIKDFRKDVDRKDISKQLIEVFNQRPLLKHCYELFGREFNELIIDSTDTQNYKHLFLERKDEVSRITSLFLAQQTSVWGPEQKKQKYNDIIEGKFELKPFDIPEMLKHMKWCKVITHKIQDRLMKNGQEFKEISFEDFYIGEKEVRLKKLYDLFNYLEFDKNSSKLHETMIEEKIFNSSQNSKDVLSYVPNLEEAISRLSLV